MRLIINTSIDKEYLPKDYRRGFMSLIKSAFEIGDKLFVQQLYDSKVDKPFTFSIYFPELKKNEAKDLLYVGGKAILNFSSNDYVIITNLYNGARKLKSHKWNSYTFRIVDLNAVFQRKIKKDNCVFKTVSPFLVNRYGDNLQYLVPEDEDFDKSFRYSVQELCKRFLNIDDIEFSYKIINHKKMVVSHYNQSMTCNKGIIEMKSHPEVLDLLYNIGIGVRRSQGFGMVDLV